MDKKTRDALEASIKHWQENVAETDVGKIDVYSGSCALCAEFYDNITEDEDGGLNCGGCPVREATGREECSGSPWGAACMAWNEWKTSSHSDEDRTRKKFKRAAKAELDFLIGLRPAESDAAE